MNVGVGNNLTYKHPAEIYHGQRRLVFGIYEKYGFDRALEYIKNSKLLPHVKAGLKGEIIFYDQEKEELKLEPLLDVGVKADFTGTRINKMVNFDVTTNLAYKDIDDYVELIQRRGKMYEIALVNPNTEEITLFPLRFPICPNCGKFSHYILYLEPPSTKMYRWGNMSDTQTVVHFCPNCKFCQEETSERFEVSSLVYEIEEMEHEWDVDESLRYSQKEIEEYLIRSSISTVQFFERTTDLLISGLAENYYVMTSPDGDGYYDGLLHWKHPLAKKLGEYLGVYYGKYQPDSSVIKALYADFKCKVCGLSSFYVNSKKLTLQCRRCGVVYDISESLKAEGYELRRVKRKKG